MYSVLNIKQHLPSRCSQGHTGQLSRLRAAAGLSTTSRLREAGSRHQQRMGVLSQGWKSTLSLCGKTQEHPSQTHLTLPFLMCPLHHASLLHCVGTLPKTQFSPHFLPLKTPGTSSCRLLPLLMQARPGSPGHQLIVQETKTTKHPAWSCWATGSETTQLPGLLCTEDDK